MTKENEEVSRDRSSTTRSRSALGRRPQPPPQICGYTIGAPPKGTGHMWAYQRDDGKWAVFPGQLADWRPHHWAYHSERRLATLTADNLILLHGVGDHAYRWAERTGMPRPGFTVHGPCMEYITRHVVAVRVEL